MNVTLEQARALDALARHGTFAAAAKALHKGHTAVLYALRTLEEQTELALLDRRGYRTRLTAAGERVLEHCRKLLAAERDAVLRGLVLRGTTLLLTTQYLEEADRLADEVAVLDGGLVVERGAPDDLKRRLGGLRLELTAVDSAALAVLGERLAGRGAEVDPATLAVRVATDGSAAEARAVLDGADPGRDLVAAFAVSAPTLDDVYLALTAGGTAAATARTEPSHV